MNDNSVQVPSESVAVILARVEVKLDHALIRGEDHESRLRNLEKKVWVASGIAALLAGFVVNLIENSNLGV